MSNSRPKRKILKDTYLYVIKKDREGDLLVNDGTWEKNTWILKRQFAKIQYLENVTHNIRRFHSRLSPLFFQKKV